VTAATANASGRRGSRLIAKAALLFPILLLPVMLAVSGDYGATFDEDLQQYRGEKITRYYAGRVADLEFPEDGSHLYGAPFDVLAVGLQRIVPADKYVVRHALNAFVGWLGIVFCGLVAHRLFGSGTALLSMILLASMPRYFGHSMNNPKDIPFATLSAAVLYALCCLPARYPFFTWRSASALALATGLALNVRPGALLFLVYAAALLGFRLQDEKGFARGPALITAAWLGGITLVTLCLGSVFWPWALERPVIGPILGLRQVSRFGWIGHVLFNGRDLDALQPVWDYVPRWMLVTTPLVTLAGLVLALLLLRKRSGQQEKAIALWATVLFPIIYIIGVRAILYDEIRHLLFIQPPIAVLAAAGWMWALRSPHAAARRLAALLLVAGLIPPIVFEHREHPNQVVYFNELVGGPAGAYGRYEMDYWGNCVLQAVAKIDGLTSAHQERPRIAGWPPHLLRIDAMRYPRLDVVDRQGGTHQLDVVLSRASRVSVLSLAARQDMVARVTTTDGALLCAVLPGPASASLAGTGHPPGLDGRVAPQANVRTPRPGGR
jgi:hypothetical protein